MKDMESMVQEIAADLKKLYNGIEEDQAEMLREDGENADLYDFVCNAMDMEYIVSSTMELIGTIIYTTLGGPTIYVDTRHCKVIGHWGTEEAQAWVPSEVCSAIDIIVQNLLACDSKCPF